MTAFIGLFGGLTAAQTLKADYQFLGHLGSSIPNAPNLSHLTGSGGPNFFTTDTVDGYTRQTLRFPFNSGLSLNTLGLIPNNSYTVVALFRFDQVSGFRRVAGSDPNDDDGAYIQNGRLELESTSNSPFRPNHYVQVAVVREATGGIRAYRDGTLRVIVSNDAGAFILEDVLRLFQDDTVSPNEASAGNIARLRVYDGPLTTTQIRALDRVANADGGGDQSLLFTSNRNGDGGSEIYSMNADGSNQRRLTNNEVTEGGARWSPDKQRIVYYRRESSTSPYQIWIMNSDGTGQTRLTNTTTNDQNPSWHPSGQKIVFSRCGTNFVCDIYTMNTVGTDQIPVTLLNTPDDEDQPMYSPDGMKIVFTCAGNATFFTDPNICVSNSDGTVRQRITNTVSPVSNHSPIFSPDSSRIAFSRRSNETNLFTSEIVVLNSNGSGETSLTNNGVYDAVPVWSPNGQRLAFNTEPEATFTEIYTMSAINGGSPVRLTVNSIADSISDWYWGPSRSTAFDFDGDGKADQTVYRPDEGNWYVNGSEAGFIGAVNWGVVTDRIVAADYDGDGRTDHAVYRNGTWWVINSNGGYSSVEWGISSDVPVPADYDGDGKADLAVYRNGTWWILYANGTASATEWGIATDIPVPADYDGDGKTDLAVYRNGTWWVIKSNGGYISTEWGISTDKPVPADYDGDGKADLAVYRDGTWWILYANGNGASSTNWGIATDKPVPADYDGDGKADLAVYRDGDWWVINSNGGASSTNWGLATDRPIPHRSAP